LGVPWVYSYECSAHLWGKMQFSSTAKITLLLQTAVATFWFW